MGVGKLLFAELAPDPLPPLSGIGKPLILVTEDILAEALLSLHKRSDDTAIIKISNNISTMLLSDNICVHGLSNAISILKRSDDTSRYKVSDALSISKLSDDIGKSKLSSIGNFLVLSDNKSLYRPDDIVQLQVDIDNACSILKGAANKKPFAFDC